MNPKIRVGAVPYLNSKPLIDGYARLAEEAEFTFAPPSGLACLMAEGELDMALGSSVDYLRGGLEVLPNVAVVSRGSVNSVLLIGDGPIEEAETVNLDPASLTSCSLVAIWFREVLGRTPTLSRFPLDSEEARRCDVQLAIGDDALRLSGTRDHQLDMGAAWEKWIGHPFVYAVWLVRRGVDTGGVGEFLSSALERVEGGLLAMAEEASEELDIDREVCVEYLTDSLQFRLDEEALEGLRAFLELAAKHHAWLTENIEGFPPLGISLPLSLEFHRITAKKFSACS